MNLIDPILNFIANKSEIIADKGATGDWNWVKYADGSCEMWGKITPENTQVLVDQLINGFYRGHAIVSYPIPLVSGIGFAEFANSNFFAIDTAMQLPSNRLTVTIVGTESSAVNVSSIKCLIKGRWK